MGKFYGRDEELAVLERIFDKESIKSCMVYGRRRIGKTSLLKKFCEGKRALFIELVNGSDSRNAEIIADAVSNLDGKSVEVSGIHNSLSLIRDVCKDSKTVVVLDEIPYLLKDRDANAAEIQHLVDWILSETDSMIVICGSSISFMMEEVFDKKKPLYGRFAFNINLKPLSIAVTREFHPSMNDVDLLRTYLTLGGVSAYHRLIGDTDYRHVIDDYLMNEFSIISIDIPYDLAEEMKGKSDSSFAVLDSISSGSSTYGEIASWTGINDNELTTCLRMLQEIGVVTKSESVPEARKSNFYTISDRLTSFYFDIVQRYSGVVKGSDSAFDSLYPMLASHLGKEFESYCRNLIHDNYPCTAVGSWWGPMPVRDEDGKIVKDVNGKVETTDVDIDVTATIRNGQNKIDLFGECKFTSKRMGFESLNKLKERVRLLKGSYNVRLALFSVSGFEEDLEEYAEDNGILLFGLDMLIGKAPLPPIQ